MTDLTPELFDEIANVNCPHCQNGMTPVQRASTKEWIHVWGKGGAFSHQICWSSGFRNSRFAEVKR